MKLNRIDERFSKRVELALKYSSQIFRIMARKVVEIPGQGLL